MRVSAAFFPSFSPLNILHTLFFSVCSLCSLPAAVSPPRSPPPLPQARGLSPPPCLPSACPPLLSVVCAVAAVAAVCLLLCPRPRALFRALCVLPCVVLLPSLVSHQAQDSVTVWADAPRVCPRPYLLLSVMCCRVFRCPFLCLSCLLPAVVWW